ncbi:MAG: hypothetical protein ACKVT2_20815 [Saprospiraceae bacterium]
MQSFTLLAGALLLFSTGCVQYHYSPNFISTPFIDKKNDGMLSAAVSGSPVSVNGDFHASYSPVKHGIVALNYFRTSSSFTQTNFLGVPNYTQTTKGNLLEASIGAYRPISFGTGALLVGWGQGRVRNDYGIGRIADLRLQRFFVQPSFTFKNSWFRLGMGLRLVRLHFPSGEVDYRIEPGQIETIQRLEQKTPFWFPEFGGNIGFHFKPITISAHLVLLASGAPTDYGFDGSNIGLGITFELQEMFKKKK